MPRKPIPLSLSDYLAGPPPVGQRDLAEAVGCHQSMISMLVKGKRVPSAGLALKLHAVTGIPLKALLAPKLARRTRRRAPPEEEPTGAPLTT